MASHGFNLGLTEVAITKGNMQLLIYLNSIHQQRCRVIQKTGKKEKEKLSKRCYSDYNLMDLWSIETIQDNKITKKITLTKYNSQFQ